MTFNSLSYVLFLWTIYMLWWALQGRRSLRHVVLLLASYWFYGQAHWGYLGLLVFSSALDFITGAAIHAAHAVGDRSRARRWLGVSIAGNLGVLAVFKYFDFFSDSVEALLRGLGVEASTWRLDLILPVGLSFYTFQTLSYSIDVYRRQLVPPKSYLDYSLYVAFFPQLVAGPIVRARDFLPQLAAPAAMTRERLSSGVYQILVGLAKKLLVADILGTHLVDPVLRDAEAVATLDALDVVILALGFALQLYGDFSGYSDVAIGSARLLGFELRRNFDSPLRAASLPDVWNRWHISLTTWFRDYLYLPLTSRWRTRNGALAAMVVSFAAMGLWHGAAWTFVLFGVVHGLALVGVYVFRLRTPGAAFRKTGWWWACSWLGTVLFTSLLGLLFPAATIGDFLAVLRGLGNWSIDGLDLPWQVWCAFAAGLVTHLAPQSAVDRVEQAWIRSPALVQGACAGLAIPIYFGLHPPGVIPFIYFQF